MNIVDELFGRTPRKRGINSRDKGTSNELRLCKCLGKWTGTEFVRIPASGGLRWKNTENICGDVISTDKKLLFPFEIETKHLKHIVLEGKPLPTRSAVDTRWSQCEADAERSNKIPLMFLRTNGMSKDTWIVYMTKSLYLCLRDSDLPHVATKKQTTRSGTFIVGVKSVDLLNINYTLILRKIKQDGNFKEFLGKQQK